MRSDVTPSRYKLGVANQSVLASRRAIHGVDFSGATDAGKKIWVASGTTEGGALRIDECGRGDCLDGSGANRERCLKALRELVAREQSGVFGFDFPFSLPREIVVSERWEDVVEDVAQRHATPEEFRQDCLARAGGREVRRQTDCEARTPFSAYNLRLYRQTYVGMRDLIAPLLRGAAARALPMQAPAPDRAWILEICPASTLKRLGLYGSYKGKGEARRDARARILERLEGTTALRIANPSIRDVAVADPGGDALDSIVAALGAFRALEDADALFAPADHPYRLEGRVYAW